MDNIKLPGIGHSAWVGYPKTFKLRISSVGAVSPCADLGQALESSILLKSKNLKTWCKQRAGGCGRWLGDLFQLICSTRVFSGNSRVFLFRRIVQKQLEKGSLRLLVGRAAEAEAFASDPRIPGIRLTDYTCTPPTQELRTNVLEICQVL